MRQSQKVLSVVSTKLHPALYPPLREYVLLTYGARSNSNTSHLSLSPLKLNFF